MNIYSVKATTKKMWEIVGGNYLVKANDKYEVIEKMKEILFQTKNLTEQITEVVELENLIYNNDIYEINKFLVD